MSNHSSKLNNQSVCSAWFLCMEIPPAYTWIVVTAYAYLHVCEYPIRLRCKGWMNPNGNTCISQCSNAQLKLMIKLYDFYDTWVCKISNEIIGNIECWCVKFEKMSWIARGKVELLLWWKKKRWWDLREVIFASWNLGGLRNFHVF